MASKYVLRVRETEDGCVSLSIGREGTMNNHPDSEQGCEHNEFEKCLDCVMKIRRFPRKDTSGECQCLHCKKERGERG